MMAGLLLALVSLCPAMARADEDYCDKTRARAGADAALLYAPSARLSGVKIPQTGPQVDPTNVGTTYQVRGELTMSATNFYKGTVVQRVADADCDAHKSAVTAQELLIHANDLGRLAALKDELAFLDAQKPAWDAIAANMQERLQAKTMTVVEVEDVRTRIVMLERQRAQLRGDVERQLATGWTPGAVNITALSQKLQQDTNRLEHDVTRVRAVEPWDVSLMAGYVPPVFSSKNDWYGVISLTYNLGGPWHGSRDGSYLTARERELKTARYEMPHQLEVLKKNVAIAVTQARAELSIVSSRMTEVIQNRAQLAQSESTLAPHALAMLDLELIASGADKTFLEGLLRELGGMQEK
jgi:hypothetical protein